MLRWSATEVAFFGSELKLQVTLREFALTVELKSDFVAFLREVDCVFDDLVFRYIDWVFGLDHVHYFSIFNFFNFLIKLKVPIDFLHLMELGNNIDRL